MNNSIPLLAFLPLFYRKDERNFYGTIELDKATTDKLLQTGSVVVYRPAQYEPLEGEFLLAFINDDTELTVEVLQDGDKFMVLGLVPVDIDQYVQSL